MRALHPRGDKQSGRNGREALHLKLRKVVQIERVEGCTGPGEARGWAEELVVRVLAVHPERDGLQCETKVAGEERSGDVCGVHGAEVDFEMAQGRRAPPDDGLDEQGDQLERERPAELQGVQLGCGVPKGAEKVLQEWHLPGQRE